MDNGERETLVLSENTIYRQKFTLDKIYFVFLLLQSINTTLHDAMMPILSTNVLLKAKKLITFSHYYQRSNRKSECNMHYIRLFIRPLDKEAAIWKK